MPSVVLVAPTFFKGVDEARFILTVKACQDAAARGLPMILVDASDDAIRATLAASGAHVVQQSGKGRKGVALREAIQLAITLHGASDPVIAFFEPEKAGIVAHVVAAAAHLRAQSLDVVVPCRDDALFRETYPIEQYHQERFANLLIDTLATKRGFPAGLDWTFGPVCFRAGLASHWTQYNGELWDAQVVPYVRAVLWHGARVGSYTVPYAHAEQMKREEENHFAWAKKRFDQLSLWVATLPPELHAETDPSSSPSVISQTQ
mmetsp:Transcript_16950/g.45637  ORF Transcript_16950/g.45637 Transcript_16950/m.45637 type:complete len:262 (+) Transcript_16950:83-868(+)